jgi:hypothetical protein
MKTISQLHAEADGAAMAGSADLLDVIIHWSFL